MDHQRLYIHLFQNCFLNPLFNQLLSQAYSGGQLLLIGGVGYLNILLTKQKRGINPPFYKIDTFLV